MSSGIYQIINSRNGKRYIGSAVDLRKRWREHLGGLRHGQHSNQHLQRAFDRDGESAFGFSVLEYVEDVSQLISREQHHMDILGPEYNISPTAGSNLGFHHSLETRRKQSKAWRPYGCAQYKGVLTKEVRRYMSGAFASHYRRLCARKAIGT